ncbi:MAG: LacI family DNA-binding transcriptional regulator [Anaerolineae bacterium]|nr:LacI family DNA-binding transcriptional regulator [Anaerolineae bacterium]
MGTVSHVLNGSTLVREETRLRVLQAIEALNYHPKAAARSLSTKRTDTIGMIRTELRPEASSQESDPFILELIAGISSALAQDFTGLTFWTVPVGPSEIALYQRVVLGGQVDGLILFAPRRNDPRIAFLKDNHFPFVLFGQADDQRDVHWIDVDGRHGVELAVDHLATLGHKRIAYLAPPAEQQLAQLRWEGFMAGMHNHRLKIERELIVEGDFSEVSGYRCARLLLDRPQPPTAIVCSNDRMAFGAMRAIQESGLDVGTDVSVVGFDDINLARHAHPPLTTVYQPIREIGHLLYQLLQALIDGQNVDGMSGQLIKPVLRVRESTGRSR